jgi:biotin carboxyl carrier protein
VSPILLVVLVLAVFGGAAYLIYRYLSGPGGAGPSAETATPTTKPVAPPPAPPPPPPPPPPVTAKIALETPPADDVKSTRAGVIETIMADKSTVKAGDVIVKFVGDKPIEAELANIARDVKRLQDAIDATTGRRDAAQSAGNKAAEAKEQAQLDTQKKNLAAKQDLQATRTIDLDKFLVHAPSAGTFTPAVKLGKKVAASDVLASIQRDPTPIAMLKVTDVKPYAVSTNVELGVGSGEQRVMCTIAEIQEGGLKVACPADPLLTEGAEVTLRTNRSKPEAAQPTDTPTPPAPPTPATPGAPAAPGGEAPAAGGGAPAAGGGAAAPAAGGGAAAEAPAAPAAPTPKP